MYTAAALLNLQFGVIVIVVIAVYVKAICCDSSQRTKQSRSNSSKGKNDSFR